MQYNFRSCNNSKRFMKTVTRFVKTKHLFLEWMFTKIQDENINKSITVEGET